jgi:hypothetical protein
LTSPPLPVVYAEQDQSVLDNLDTLVKLNQSVLQNLNVLITLAQLTLQLLRDVTDNKLALRVIVDEYVDCVIVEQPLLVQLIP